MNSSSPEDPPKTRIFLDILRVACNYASLGIGEGRGLASQGPDTTGASGAVKPGNLVWGKKVGPASAARRRGRPNSYSCPNTEQLDPGRIITPPNTRQDGFHARYQHSREPDSPGAATALHTTSSQRRLMRFSRKLDCHSGFLRNRS